MEIAPVTRAAAISPSEVRMLHGRRIVVVLPAYNAEKTLERTFREVPRDIADLVLLVDDGSHDRTVEVARGLGIQCHVHPENRGYGANQKTCYTLALREGADIVVMVHPDYQYTPRLITAMAARIASGEFDVVLGSRILGTGALEGGMPFYKYVSNRFLTLSQNLLVGHKLSEYHTGFRAFRREVLENLPLLENSDDFVFDNQVLVQAIRFGFRIGEITCPTRYLSESSSISFRRSVVYGLGVLRTSLQYVLTKRKIREYPFLNPGGRKLEIDRAPDTGFQPPR
jgi:glycosyltransferase involved in cell wall biosynthesis